MKSRLIIITTLFVALFFLIPQAILFADEFSEKLTKASLLYNEGKYFESKVMLIKLIEEQPDNINAHRLMGHVLFGLDLMDEAEKEFLLCIKYDYITKDITERLIQIEQKRCNLPMLVATIAFRLVYEPDNAEWLLWYADALALMDNKKKAKDIYLSLIDRWPTSTESYVRLAGIYIRDGDNLNAVKMLGTAYFLGSLYPDIEKTVAELYVNLGDYYSAIDWYNKALAKHENNKEILLRCAELFIKVQLLNCAEEALIHLLACDSSSINTRAKYLIAHIAASTGNADKAALYWAEYVSKEENVDVLRYLANYYIKKGNPEQALIYLERVIEYDPQDYVLRRTCIACYLKIGDIEKAQEGITTYISILGVDEDAQKMIVELSALAPASPMLNPMDSEK